MSAGEYNFGMEIEAIVRPYARPNSVLGQHEWYKRLAQKLTNHGVKAVHDAGGAYCTHPEYYGEMWFVTRDGSLTRTSPFGSCRPRHAIYVLFSCS
jgi:hypothetical protein